MEALFVSTDSFPDDYKEEAALRGAKPLYTPRVLQRNGTNKTTSECKYSVVFLSLARPV